MTRTIDAKLRRALAAVGHVCEVFTEEECMNYFVAAGYEPD